MKNTILIFLSAVGGMSLAACGGSGSSSDSGAQSACTGQDLALVVEGQVTNHSAETFMIDIRKASTGPVQVGGYPVPNEVLSYRDGDDAINFRFESLFVYLRSFSDAVGTYPVKDYGDNFASSQPPPDLSPGEAAVPGLSEPFRPTTAEYDIGPARGGTVTIQSFDTVSKTVHLTFDLEYPLGGRLRGCLRASVEGDIEPTPDAGVPMPDAAPPDAMFVPPAFGTFIVNEIDLPADTTTSDQYGFDLDGDGTIDNQMGNILSSFSLGLGSTAQPTLTAYISDGTILLLAAGVGCTDGPCLSTFAGTSPSPTPCAGVPAVCGRHLQGTGSFALDPAEPTDLAVRGTFDGATFVGASGSLLLPIVMLPDSPPVWVDLLLAQARLAGVSAGFGPSKLGGAIPEAEVQSHILPAMQAGIAADIQRDCTGVGPSCGCTNGSWGATLLGLFDADGDCGVSSFEFTSDALIETLMRPDVDSDGDGQPDALSIGVQVTGVAATFTLP